MTVRKWTYPPDFVEALLPFGLQPTEQTPPVFVREALNDLYRYEIRRLRQRLLDGHIAKSDYQSYVVALRKKYWPLSLQPRQWEAIVKTTSEVDASAADLRRPLRSS